MVTIQKYVKAQSLEEAWKLNQGKKNRILGGMLWMRLGNGTISRSEERRVGKECRSRWSPYH